MEQIMEALEKQLKKINSLEKSMSYSKPIWTIEELCAFTNLSKSHIYKLTYAGLIPFYKKSKHLFFDREEILVWLKENRGFNKSEIEDEANSAIVWQGGVR